MTNRVACIQTGALGTWYDNVERAVSLARRANGDLIVLPELFAHCKDFKAGERIPGATSDAFAQLACEKHIYILMGSVLEVDEYGRRFNSSVLIDRSGQILATYRKIHLFSYRSKERRLLVAGDRVVTVPTELGVIGLSICYDLRFPELFRALVRQGAEIILCPAAWPHTRLDHWITLNRARAIEGQCYFIGCNQVGRPVPAVELAGRSMITDPWGKVIAEAGHVETIIEAEIDVAVVRRIREEYAFLPDIVEL